MNPAIVVQDFRPDEILWAYWAQILSLEEDALRLEPEFLEGL